MPEAPYLVFSDVDETLIHCKSMLDFLRFYLVRVHGEEEGTRRYERIWAGVVRENAAGRDRREINRDYYRGYAGVRTDLVTALGREWFERKRSAGELYIEETADALRAHAAAGAAVVLVSGSFPACLGPVAEDIGAARLLCADLITEVDADGVEVYTGEIVEPVIGPGKEAAVRRVLAEYPAIDPDDCYGYGDHPSDIPMLDLVGRPVGVGSDPKLRAYLAERAAMAAVSTPAGPGRFS